MWLCVCFTDFAYFYVRLLRTYMAFAYVSVRLLRMLCGFCVRIRLIFYESCAAFVYIYGFLCLLSGFTYVYGLSFAMFDADRLRGSDTAGSLICYCQCEHSWFVESIKDPILRVTLSSFSTRAIHYYWTVSTIWSLGFCRVPFPRELLIIIGPSRGSDIEGSAKFSFRRSARVHRPILPRRFLVDLNRAIYLFRWSNTAMHYAAMWYL